MHLAPTTAATPPAATCPGASAPAPPPSPATWRPPAFVTLPGQKSDIPWAEATLAAWTGGEVHTLGITVTGEDGIGCGGKEVEAAELCCNGGERVCGAATIR